MVRTTCGTKNRALNVLKDMKVAGLSPFFYQPPPLQIASVLLGIICYQFIVKKSSKVYSE